MGNLGKFAPWEINPLYGSYVCIIAPYITICPAHDQLRKLIICLDHVNFFIVNLSVNDQRE